jgi:hypothetical protein
MTPENHATAANDLLTATAAHGDSVTATRNAQQAVVHALLATKAGTGPAYSSAEAELVIAATPTGTTANLARAHAYALLAS